MKKTIIGIIALFFILITATSALAYTQEDVSYCKKVMASYESGQILDSTGGQGGDTYDGTTNIKSVEVSSGQGKTVLKRFSNDDIQEINVKVEGNDQVEKKRRLQVFADKHAFTCEDCEISLTSANTPVDYTQIKKEYKKKIFFFEVTATETFIVDEEGQIQQSKKNIWANILGGE